MFEKPNIPLYPFTHDRLLPTFPCLLYGGRSARLGTEPPQYPVTPSPHSQGSVYWTNLRVFARNEMPRLVRYTIGNIDSKESWIPLVGILTRRHFQIDIVREHKTGQRNGGSAPRGRNPNVRGSAGNCFQMSDEKFQLNPSSLSSSTDLAEKAFLCIFCYSNKHHHVLYYLMYVVSVACIRGYNSGEWVYGQTRGK